MSDQEKQVVADYVRRVETAAKVANVSSRERNRAELALVLTKLRILRAINIVLWATIGLLAAAWVMWK